MSSEKFFVVLWGSLLLVGLMAVETLAQSPAPSRDSGASWDSGPIPGGPPGPGRGEGPRRGDGPRGERGMPFGPSDMGPGPRGDRMQPGEGMRRGGPFRGNQGDRGPGGPEGRGMQPPGPPGMWMDVDAMMKARDPQLYQLTMEDRDLERQSREQAEQYRQAGKDEQAKIREKLAQTVEKHFAVRQQLRTLEVKRLEEQVKQLHDKIDEREKNRREIVSKRITELTVPDDNRF
jgi:hypothetical protein